MIAKPEIGAPCNACGLCCQVQICSTGSFVLGLVEKFGERAAGPCPLLVASGERLTCGLVARPKDHIQSPRGVTVVREAVLLLIGSGAGCDEAGDEPDRTAQPKLNRLVDDYVSRHGEQAFARAADVVFRGR